MAPATEPRAALIVSHGSPSAPERPEAELTALADRVAARLPGWAIRGATLAGRDTLKAALDTLGNRQVSIYPLFMSDGWFVSRELPRRIGELRDGSFSMLSPLGLDPALHALCLDCVRRAASERDLSLEETTILLAAHGSPSDPRPREAAEKAARFIAAAGLFREIRVGFVDEAPYLAEAAWLGGPALCLPFFAGRAGHVDVDLPRALAEVAFPGPILDPVGTRSEIAPIVAVALSMHAGKVAA
ncbi:sirohydrochlorin chelatase [Aurantimonas marina]|uniref:sirohydrochlorin chelatase n=1 Tax=Aurantimonas marina TaxID=2780508 RepID=UPI0019D303CC|nr:CbiX/SirB N-terminal domain-containing protein [Aurantimonas marina]